MASPFVPPLDSTPGSSPHHTPLPPVVPGPPGGPPAGAAPPWAQTPHTPAAYPAAAPTMYPPGYPPYGYGGPPPATPYMGGGYGQPPPPPGPPPPQARGGWGASWPPPEPPRSHGWSADPGPHRPPGVSDDYIGYPPQSFTSPWAAQPPLPGGWGAPPPPAAPPPHAGGYGYRAQPMASAYTPYGGSWGATPAAPYGAFPHDPYGGPPPGTPWAGGPAPVMPPPPIPPAPGPPAAPRGHTGDRVDKFAAGPHYGPVLNPLLLKVTNATLELHPLLQPPPDDPADRPHLRWNMTFPTSHCQKSTDRPNESWMRGRGDPATFPRLSELRLIPDKTAWTITVRAADPALGVTCGEVIEAIKEDMYKFTGRPDYEALSRAERHAVGRAYAGNRAPAPGVVGGALGEGMRRFDFLVANRMFGGLEIEANTQRTAGLPAVFILKCAQPLRAEMEAHEAVSRRIEEEAREREEREERLQRIRESRASEAGSRAGSHASASRAGSRAGEPRTTSRSTLSATGSRAGSRAHSRTSSRHLASVTSTSDEDSSSD